MRESVWQTYYAGTMGTHLLVLGWRHVLGRERMAVTHLREIAEDVYGMLTGSGFKGHYRGAFLLVGGTRTCFA